MCADRNSSGGSVIIYFNLFNVRSPHSVCPSADLTSCNTDSVPRADAFFADFTFCHKNAPPFLVTFGLAEVF